MYHQGCQLLTGASQLKAKAHLGKGVDDSLLRADVPDPLLVVHTGRHHSTLEHGRKLLRDPGGFIVSVESQSKVLEPLEGTLAVLKGALLGDSSLDDVVTLGRELAAKLVLEGAFGQDVGISVRSDRLLLLLRNSKANGQRCEELSSCEDL